eukprot:CAMPEP_0170510272 /NCGR_PEP_ID=MMETSP0208-20121228/65678_1 /TAXON_ID=197538 /ORGANISM="Strombidium inclinatum, Strain S3" /LENGTH=62 /DNA_ID=CAMNT_0010793723 /DNA_START=5283 /DNA_END=5471 /DNA_ORIENTATION=+
MKQLELMKYERKKAVEKRIMKMNLDRERRNEKWRHENSEVKKLMKECRPLFKRIEEKYNEQE